MDVLAVSGVLGRGGRAKAGPLEVPSAANPRRGKRVKALTLNSSNEGIKCPFGAVIATSGTCATHMGAAKRNK